MSPSPPPVAATRPRPSSKRRNESHRLNIAFCRDRKVVYLGRTENAVTIGMVDPNDTETISALRFATGAEIHPVLMSPEEVSARLDQPVDAANPDSPLLLTTLHPGPAAEPVSRDHKRSLASYAIEAFAARTGRTAPYEALRLLLLAGYDPSSAGSAIMAASAAGQRFDEAQLVLARHLMSGSTFEAGIQDQPALPDWLRSAMSSLPERTEQVPVLVALLKLEGDFFDRRAVAGRLMAEVAVLAVPALLAWWYLSAIFAAFVALLVWIVAQHLGRQHGSGINGDFFRANVLDVIAVLSRYKVPSGVAIRSGLVRLQNVSPTWGRVPDTREELGRALKLDPLAEAILLRGDLVTAAGCAARHCANRGERTLAYYRWILRMAAIALLGLAAVMMVT